MQREGRRLRDRAPSGQGSARSPFPTESPSSTSNETTARAPNTARGPWRETSGATSSISWNGSAHRRSTSYSFGLLDCGTKNKFTARNGGSHLHNDQGIGRNVSGAKTLRDLRGQLQATQGPQAPDVASFYFSVYRVSVLLRRYRGQRSGMSRHDAFSRDEPCTPVSSYISLRDPPSVFFSSEMRV